MPTNTFFRLPEEKRMRLLDAAWDEFTKVSYPDASINRIILNAHIPRGSFYQYFTDKKDLFLYLCKELRQYLSQVVESELRNSRGNLFDTMVRLYDDFSHSTPCLDYRLKRSMQICHLNPGMNLRQIFQALPDLMHEPFWSLVDTSNFRQKDPVSLKDSFILLGMTTIANAISTLVSPEHSAEHRQALLAHIEIIKYGCLNPSEAAPQ